MTRPIYINVRGCNGSGKTTLLRSLAKAVQPLSLGVVKPPDHRPIPVTYGQGGIAILGDYTPGATGTTAGCDRIKTQDATKRALEIIGRDPEVKVVLFEGVVVSTIFGPWKDWAECSAPGPLWWAFLDTPVSLCLRRIQQRNGGKPIKEELVVDKHLTIDRVREKADMAGLNVVVIDHTRALSELRRLIGDLVS